MFKMKDVNKSDLKDTGIASSNIFCLACRVPESDLDYSDMKYFF